MDEQQLMAMYVGQSEQFPVTGGSTMEVLRVPGGWIYTRLAFHHQPPGIFVPVPTGTQVH